MKEKILKMLIDRATTFIGTTEHGGDNRGKNVEMFQKAVDGKASREAWCMCFVQHCIKEVMKNVDATKVKKSLFSSEHCMTVWNNTEPRYRLSKPQIGAIVIWQYYKDGKATASGHTGIVTGITADGKSMMTIEGNTGPGGDIIREGDGVHKKVRTVQGSTSMRVKGFIMPFDFKE